MALFSRMSRRTRLTASGRAKNGRSPRGGKMAIVWSRRMGDGFAVARVL
jgi:hypothetical protein